jgi:hypothetical protein
MKNLKFKRYIGDGVYAGFDGYLIWIWVEPAGQPKISIALEAETLASLAKYTADLKHMWRLDAEREEI